MRPFEPSSLPQTSRSISKHFEASETFLDFQLMAPLFPNPELLLYDLEREAGSDAIAEGYNCYASNFG